jgi:hypothetical protein
VLEGFSISYLAERINAFFISVYARADEVSMFVAKLYLVAGLTAAVVYAVRQQPRALFSGRFRPVTLLVITSFAAFLFFPGAIRQAWFLNERFVVFSYLFLTALLGMIIAATEYRPRWGFAALLLVLTFNAVNLGYRFVEFDQEARPVARLLSPLAKDKKLLGLMYETKTKPDLLGYDFFLHFANYYQIWNRGYPGFSFASIRFSPIQYRDSTEFLPPGFEWSPSEYVFPDGWQVYDYFLLHGRAAPQDQQYIDQWQVVRSDGDWALYRKPDK